jgi:hypothetical protein
MPAVGSNEWKIAAFTSAAPPEISAGAKVMDWVDSASGQMQELRAGTNGWTCMPTTPSGAGVATASDAAPVCLDQAWADFFGAWMTKTTPAITSVGVAYMLQGDKGGSNTDPWATGPTADNDWVVSGPHVMVLVPDTKALETMRGDHRLGEPYVMWKGTPYAHIMMPVGAHKM